MKLVIEDSKTAEQLNVLFTNLCWLSDYVTIHKEEEDYTCREWILVMYVCLI